MKQFLEKSDIPRILEARINDAGGIEKFADLQKINVDTLKYFLVMLREGEEVTPRFTERVLGLRKLTVYERIEG